MAEPRVRARGPGWRGEAQGRHRSAVGCGAGQGAGGRWPGGERRVELGTRGAPS